jgi:hypothetical protein
MSQLRISGKPEDWTNWEKLIEQCSTYDEFTDIEKEKAERAFLFLKQEFGEEFLKNAFEELHPIMYYFVNSAPWTRKCALETQHKFRLISMRQILLCLEVLFTYERQNR